MDIITELAKNSLLVQAVSYAIYALIAIAIIVTLMFVVAFVQNRRFRFWPPAIGAKLNTKKSQSTEPLNKNTKLSPNVKNNCDWIKKAKYDFQKEMIKDEELRCVKRKEAILQLNYNEPLNWEKDFLQSAKHLYAGATAVYAITLSSISDFWISEKDKELIIQYLKCQKGKEVHRLFVFDSPYDLVKYEEVLAANYESYGNIGGVYVTSKQNYLTEVLDLFCELDKREKFIQKDFGVWEFEKTSIFATLEGMNFNYREIKKNELQDFSVSTFKNSFHSSPVTRWDSNSKSEDIAKKIFEDDVTYVGTVMHIVLIKHTNHDILESIASKMLELDKIQINAIKKGIGISFESDEPWWGRNLKSIESLMPFTDGMYGGVLESDCEYQYALIIRLPTINDLRTWYGYDEHSIIRKEVYMHLEETVRSIYASIEHCVQPTAKAELFQDIESKIKDSGKLKRMDFIYNKKLIQMKKFEILNGYRSQSQI